MSKYDSVGVDISSYAFNLSTFIYFMGKSITLIPKDVSERTIPTEDRESQRIVPNYKRRTQMNTQLFFREKVAVKKSMRNFNNALQTTLPRERNNSRTPPCGQLSIPVLSLFSICNYHNSLPNKLFRVSVQFMFYFFACNNT